MKVIVKTLKGEKFPIEIEASATVEQIKAIIESTKADMPAATLKLIHSGKVLKDGDAIASCGIKENDFLVVMVTKPKKPAAVAAAVAPPSTPVAAPAPAALATTTPAAAAPSEAPPAAPARPDVEFSDEMISNLTALGFPEAEVRHCLRAASGNPDVAVEFLTNGIPPSVSETGAASPVSGSSGRPLEALRNHPQFNDLRRLVQSNPAMLQQVLTQIGQQQPELLREINANQAAFLQLMNEPITEGSSAASTSGSAAPPQIPAEMMGDPAQMAQMMQNMDPGQLQMMATMMGLSPEQVQAVGRMIGQLPPDQLQEYMAQAMGGGGGGGGGGGAAGGPQVLRLNEEEMAAVDRLTEMGFDRSEAAQAFLACDKNEALAANLLMDGGFGFGGGDADMGGNNNDDNDDDDMYS